MPANIHQQILHKLQQLENVLQTLGWWSEIPPSSEALRSPEPFCYDTMPLHQWLQWVFIPSMQQLAVNRQALPDSCAIAPLAELEWAKEKARVAELIRLLQQIDSLISSEKFSTQAVDNSV